jgi:hypothetical protein
MCLAIDQNGAITLSAATTAGDTLTVNGSDTGTALTVNASTTGSSTSPAVLITGAGNSNDIVDITGVDGGTGNGLTIDLSAAATSGIGLQVTGSQNGTAAVVINGTNFNPPLQLNTPNAALLSDSALTIDTNGNVNKLSGDLPSNFVLNGGQTGGVNLGTNDANTLQLSTKGVLLTPRLTIDSAGQVTVNAPDSGVALTVNGNNTGVGNAVTITQGAASNAGNALRVAAADTATTSPAVFIQGAANATTIMTIQGVAGGSGTGLNIDVSTGMGVGLTIDGNTTAASPLIVTNLPGGVVAPNMVYDQVTGVIGYNTSSKRFKENFRSFEDTSGLYRLKPTVFDFKQKNGGAKDQIGFLAEEVGEIFPTMVYRDKAGLIHSVLYDSFHALTVKEIQNLRKALDSCEERLQAQSTLIESLLHKIAERK